MINIPLFAFFSIHCQNRKEVWNALLNTFVYIEFCRHRSILTCKNRQNGPPLVRDSPVKMIMPDISKHVNGQSTKTTIS